MTALWEKLKSAWPNLLWFIAGAILLIDPKHIDSIVAAHPKWAGLILFLWTAVLTWAQKHRPQPDVYPPGTGANPVPGGTERRQGPPSQKPYTGGLR